MNGLRKVEMLKRAQWFSFIICLLFLMLKAFATGGAPGLGVEVLLAALAGVSGNLAIFVAGNVKGDHGKGKNDAPAAP